MLGPRPWTSVPRAYASGARASRVTAGAGMHGSARTQYLGASCIDERTGGQQLPPTRANPEWPRDRDRHRGRQEGWSCGMQRTIDGSRPPKQQSTVTATRKVADDYSRLVGGAAAAVDGGDGVTGAASLLPTSHRQERPKKLRRHERRQSDTATRGRGGSRQGAGAQRATLGGRTVRTSKHGPRTATSQRRRQPSASATRQGGEGERDSCRRERPDSPLVDGCSCLDRGGSQLSQSPVRS